MQRAAGARWRRGRQVTAPPRRMTTLPWGFAPRAAAAAALRTRRRPRRACHTCRCSHHQLVSSLRLSPTMRRRELPPRTQAMRRALLRLEPAPLLRTTATSTTRPWTRAPLLQRWATWGSSCCAACRQRWLPRPRWRQWRLLLLPRVGMTPTISFMTTVTQTAAVGGLQRPAGRCRPPPPQLPPLHLLRRRSRCHCREPPCMPTRPRWRRPPAGCSLSRAPPSRGCSSRPSRCAATIAPRAPRPQQLRLAGAARRALRRAPRVGALPPPPMMLMRRHRRRPLQQRRRRRRRQQRRWRLRRRRCPAQLPWTSLSWTGSVRSAAWAGAAVALQVALRGAMPSVGCRRGPTRRCPRHLAPP